MKIQYLGHACFKLIPGDDSLIIDPYADDSVDGFGHLREEATMVIYSHKHADHYGVDCVKLIDGDESKFKVDFIQSWHDDQEGALRGPNLIHIITCEGLRIAHLGDLGCPLNEEQKEQLTNLDVLMIPVGGHFTIDADLAADITKSLAPKCAIPMHYRGDDFGYDVLSTVDEYTRHFDNVRKVGNIIEVNNDMPEVAVMDFRA